MEEAESATPEAPNNKNLTMILGLVIVVILGAAALFIFNNRTSSPQTSSTNNQTAQPTTAQQEAVTTPAGSSAPTSGSAMAGEAKTITVEAKNFSFTPSVINAKVGDKIVIVLNSKEGFHDFNIEGMDVKTKTISAGQTDQVEFTASKAGTFEYYCSVGNHRKMGMVGKLIVQ